MLDRPAETFVLLRIDGPANPPPKGFCEVWQCDFDSARRVEIMATEICEEAPGTVHLVSHLPGSHKVRGVFYVREGQTLAGRTTYF